MIYIGILIPGWYKKTNMMTETVFTHFEPIKNSFEEKKLAFKPNYLKYTPCERKLLIQVLDGFNVHENDDPSAD